MRLLLKLLPALLLLAALTPPVSAESSAVRPASPQLASVSRVRLVGDVSAVALPRARLLRWVRHAARTVAGYYGHFPAPPVEVSVRRAWRSGVGSGHTYEGRRIVVRLGRRVTQQALADDWVLVHELLHTTFPRLARRHRWMREGLSTYLEPILRVRAGDVDEPHLWGRLSSGLPNGLPRAGDRGLDHTPTWGRVYWGGTLFWLLADLGIRRETQGRRSLRDALTAIARAGGNGRVQWPIARVLRVGDRATGTRVMSRLYERMAASPHPVDLEAIFSKLGVRPAAHASEPARLDDSAPWARVRRAIAHGR